MIFVKHFVFLAILFAFIPVLARLAANRVQRIAGVASVPIDWAFVAQTALLGILFPLAAQGGFQFLASVGVPLLWARVVALGLVGLGYGVFLSLQEYVHGFWAISLALVGGVGTALLYGVLPYNEATQALLAVTLTALPMLALEVPGGPIPRTLFSGRVVLPIRGYLR